MQLTVPAAFLDRLAGKTGTPVPEEQATLEWALTPASNQDAHTHVTVQAG